MKEKPNKKIHLNNNESMSKTNSSNNSSFRKTNSNSNLSTKFFFNNSEINNIFNITNTNNYKVQIKVSDLFSSLPQFYKNYKRDSHLTDRNITTNANQNSKIYKNNDIIILPTIKDHKFKSIKNRNNNIRSSRVTRASNFSKLSKAVDYSTNTTIRNPREINKFLKLSPYSNSKKNKYFLSLINFNIDKGKYKLNLNNLTKGKINNKNLENEKEKEKDNFDEFFKLEYTDSEDEGSRSSNKNSKRKNRNFRKSMPGLKPKNTKEFDLTLDSSGHTEYLNHNNFINYNGNEPILEIENEEKIEEIENVRHKRNVNNIIIENSNSNNNNHNFEDVYNASRYMKLSTKNNLYQSYHSTEDLNNNIESNKNMFNKTKSYLSNQKKRSSIYGIVNMEN